MNGFTEPVSGASEQRGPTEKLLTWGESLAMLPLVGRVVKDVMKHRQRLAALNQERNQLDRRRIQLDWPQRQRRYQLNEEILATEKELRAVETELETLGIALLEADTGLVGFPTMVNNRPAFFSWRPEEEALSFWNFSDDTVRRPIPQEWTKVSAEASARGRSKSRK